MMILFMSLILWGIYFRTLYNLTDMRINPDKNETISKIDDWDSTLYKRGFEQIVTDFLLAVKTGGKTQFTTQDALITHQICEDVVTELNKLK